MVIGAPLVDITTEEPAAVVIVSGAAALVLLSSESAPPAVATEELTPKFRNGAINLSALPPSTVKATPSARLIEPVGSLLRTFNFLK